MTQVDSGKFSSEDQANESVSGQGLPVWILVGLALFSAIIYGMITHLSERFRLEFRGVDRPLIFVLLLFGSAFLLYLASIFFAVKTKQDGKLTLLIFGAAIIFRLTVLFSTPIQEVDIYRYIWDGVVCSQGISPFEYSPDQVKMASSDDPADPDLQLLAQIRDNDKGLADVLGRVHFSELPTVYPATSQAVFSAAALTTPSGSSLQVRVLVMKFWLMLFDLGTLILVIRLLRLASLPIGLSVAYGWCPLVMKEVANSGHLDAIAVFATTAVVLLFARIVVDANQQDPATRRLTGRLVLTALMLAAAIGAKLYPVVLVPLVLLVTLRRFGWQACIAPGITLAVATFVLLWPMLPKPSSQKQAKIATTTVSATDEDTNDPSRGVRAFLESWEMNDFIFMVVVENMIPEEVRNPPQYVKRPRVWFSKLPDASRVQLVDFVSERYGVDRSKVAFLTTRGLMSVIFLGLAFYLAWNASSNPTAENVCQAAFLTIAWFWLLCPTQNPWYWLWALPFLPFMKNRAWYAMAGLVMVYYLRFWFEYHWYADEVMGTIYRGTDFFDFIVTWLEFAPWFIWLFVEGLIRYFKRQ